MEKSQGDGLVHRISRNGPEESKGYLWQEYAYLYIDIYLYTNLSINTIGYSPLHEPARSFCHDSHGIKEAASTKSPALRLTCQVRHWSTTPKHGVLVCKQVALQTGLSKHLRLAHYKQPTDYHPKAWGLREKLCSCFFLCRTRVLRVNLRGSSVLFKTHEPWTRSYSATPICVV